MGLALVVALLSTGAPGWAAPLTADEAVERAAAQNPTLRAALADVAAARASLAGEQGARSPVFFAATEGTYTERLSGGGDEVTRSASEGTDGRAGVRYTTDVGTALEAGLTGGVTWQDGDGGSPAPSVSGQLYVQVTQPLLRGAGSDSVLAPLRGAELGVTEAELARDDAASQLVLDVLNAYWELWYAERSVEVEEEALSLAERQYEEAKLRESALGTKAPIDSLSFATQLASARQSLASARAGRTTRAIALGRLLALGPTQARTLDAVTPPPDAPPPPPVETLLADARARSPELAGLAAQVEAAKVSLAGAEAEDAPRLDLTGAFSMSGLWNDDALPGLVLPGDRPAFAASVGLEIELPLGDSRQAAAHARAAAQLESAEARYEARRDSLEADVAAQHVEAENAVEQAALAGETAQASAALAEAERQRFALGNNTAADVVKAQQAEREAALRVLRARVDRVEADLALAHATGRLLPRYAQWFEEVSTP